MTPSVSSFINSFNSKLEEPVRAHLKNVYACLTITTVAAAAGAYIDLYTSWINAGLLTTFGALGLILLLISTPDNGKNTHLRAGYLFGFGFLSGMGLGPLLEHVIMVNPSIIVTALMGTSLAFVSFSLAALFAERGRWLFLGGTMMTLLTTMTVMSLANLFFRSTIVYQAHIYLGLVLMCGFILFDTQMIIEKRRAGNKDFIAHALDLFIDFIGIFKRLLIILTQKEEQDRRRKRN